MIARNQANRLTETNYAYRIENMRELSYRIVYEYMIPYEDLIKVDYT